MLPDAWDTERLTIRDSQLPEVSRLHAIFNACNYVEKWDNSFREETEEGIAALVSKSLVPYENSARAFQMQSIRIKGSPAIIGYFHLYYGVPQPEIALISMFVIHPDYHSHHYGSEVVEGWSQQMRDHSGIWLEAYLKNWPALRFWISAGFDHIVEYRGEKTHSQDAYASLILEKRLDK
jgi:diamine N-acetyltransferase